jgi:hypothetical protein
MMISSDALAIAADLPGPMIWVSATSTAIVKIRYRTVVPTSDTVVSWRLIERRAAVSARSPSDGSRRRSIFIASRLISTRESLTSSHATTNARIGKSTLRQLSVMSTCAANTNPHRTTRG